MNSYFKWITITHNFFINLFLSFRACFNTNNFKKNCFSNSISLIKSIKIVVKEVHTNECSNEIIVSLFQWSSSLKQHDYPCHRDVYFHHLKNSITTFDVLIFWQLNFVFFKKKIDQFWVCREYLSKITGNFPMIREIVKKQ